MHVCKSLHGHIHVPMFGNCLEKGGGGDEPQKRLRYTVLSTVSDGISQEDDDVDMEDISLGVSGSKLV